MYIKSDSFIIFFHVKYEQNMYFISINEMDIFCQKMWASEVIKFDIHYVLAYEFSVILHT